MQTNVLATPADVRVSRVSWGAVFTGLFLAMVVYLFLGVLGTAIGTASIDAMEQGNPLAGFGTGASVWVGLSTLIALGLGAFFAGRTAPGHGALHGTLTWAVTTLVTFYLLSSLAGGVIGTAARVAGSGVAMAGQGIAAVAPSVASEVSEQLKKNNLDFDFSNAQRELEKLLRQTGKPELNPDRIKNEANQAMRDGKETAGDAATTPQAGGNELGAFFDRLRNKAQPKLEAADREALVNVIAARTGKPRAEAEQIAANYEQTYNQAVAKYEELKVQAEQKAREAADATAKRVSQAAWAGVVVLILGFLVSAGAGLMGRRSAPHAEVVVAR